MEIVTFNNINDLCEFLKFDKIGKILDDDVYDITDDTCSNDRKLRDAEVLTFIAKNIYNLKSERLYPYHILFVNNELIMPKNFETFVFKTEIKIRIIPFVSGG